MTICTINTHPRTRTEKQLFNMRIHSGTIKRILKEELKNADAERIANNEINNYIKSKDFEKKVREIVSDALEDFTKTLWQRSSSWKSGVKI